jgi:hypothetical protein
MAHFAELDENNVVLRVIVVNNEVITNENGEEKEALGIAFCKGLLGENTRWVQTSYNGSFRAHYCGPGHIYDEKLDVFYPPKPYNSWVLNKSVYLWEAPSPYPNDGNLHGWNEDKLAWEKIELPKAS